MTITGDFERFYYLNFETHLLKNKKLFWKGEQFFSWTYSVRKPANAKTNAMVPWHWWGIKNLNILFKIINTTVDRQFDAYTIVDLTLAQRSNRRLCNRWFDACTIVHTTLAQPANQHLCDGRLCNRGFDACKKEFILLCSREKHCDHQHRPFFWKKAFAILFSIFYRLVLLQIQQRWWFDKAKSKFQTWPNI